MMYHYLIKPCYYTYILTGTIQACLDPALSWPLPYPLILYVWSRALGCTTICGWKGGFGLYLVPHVIVVALGVVYHMLWYVLFTVREHYRGGNVLASMSSVFGSGDVKPGRKILSMTYPYILYPMI